MKTLSNELFAHAAGAARNVYPRVVILWVMFLALVVMANPS